MTSAADGGSTWSSEERPGDGPQYETDEGPVVPTHDHEADTHASPEVSEDMTESAQREREPSPAEPEESWPVGGGGRPERGASSYQTDEGPVVPTRDHDADTHADPDRYDG